MRMSRLKEPLFDLKKIFPNYFSVWLFRSVMIIILLFAVFVSYSNDWQVSFNYAYCPFDSSGTPCDLYVKEWAFGEEQHIVLQQGESWGVMPNWFGQHFSSIIFLLLVFAFLFNHYLAWRRGVRF